MSADNIVRFTIDPELKEILYSYAKRKDVSITNVCVNALRRYLIVSKALDPVTNKQLSAETQDAVVAAQECRGGRVIGPAEYVAFLNECEKVVDRIGK